MTRQPHRPIGPGDYWHIGPVYIRKGLFLVLLGAAALLILGIFGLPLSWLNPLSPLPPLYRYNDPALRTLSGTVRIADDAGRVRYIGEIAQGTYTGTGKVYDESGQLCYEGPLVNGVYEGSAAKVYSHGQLVYSGDMVQNQYEGQGRRIDLETGVVSEGQFARNKLEGEGAQYDADGNLLREGTFSQDLLNGPGKEYSSNGTLLREGTFVQGLLHGDGMEYTQSGLLRYQGQFQRGVYHGSGQLYDTDTQSLLYRGEFVQGMAKGQGQIYHPSGQLLYTGVVYDVQPRADAFLSLSLTEVEQAFSQHWQAYVYGNVTAFVYPYFHLMFVSESPVEFVSSPEAEGEGGEILSPETDKTSVLITQALSYGQPLPAVPQPDSACALLPRLSGWEEWFSAYALGEKLVGAVAVQTGPLVYRFTAVGPAQEVEQELAEDDTLETATVRNTDKDGTIWYQRVKWRDVT